nr:hypothetical protein [Tanacetum cinerariifolium]
SLFGRLFTLHGDGETVNLALYGFPLPLHIPYIPKDSGDKEVDELMRDREVTMNVLKQSLHKAQNRMKHQADKHQTEREFSVGSWVYLKLQPYMQNSLRVNKHSKLTPKVSFPFTSLEGARSQDGRGSRAAMKILVQWKDQSAEDATWEYLDELQLRFPDLSDVIALPF